MKPEELCFGILAGGSSRRMQQDKKDLLLPSGETFLNHLIKKARGLGFGEILVSYNGGETLAAPALPDLLFERGPLGGLESLLCSMKSRALLAISCDTPLVPSSFLLALAKAAGDERPLLAKTFFGEEPLLAVYPKKTGGQIRPLIAQKGAPVRCLLERTGFDTLPYTGPEMLVKSINTPADYKALINFRNAVKK